MSKIFANKGTVINGKVHVPIKNQIIREYENKKVFTAYTNCLYDGIDIVFLTRFDKAYSLLFP